MVAMCAKTVTIFLSRRVAPCDDDFFPRWPKNLPPRGFRGDGSGIELFYIPTVKEQNSGKAVKFKLTSSSDTQLIFKNPKHDFPHTISYTQISNDTLLAEISGMMEGKHNSRKFPMTRVK